MAWSYRSDRSDEVYGTSGGPAAVTTEKLPRPPSDSENVEKVKDEAKDKEKVDKEAPPEKPTIVVKPKEEK
jgi:hypothetical protein